MGSSSVDSKITQLQCFKYKNSVEMVPASGTINNFNLCSCYLNAIRRKSNDINYCHFDLVNSDGWHFSLCLCLWLWVMHEVTQKIVDIKLWLARDVAHNQCVWILIDANTHWQFHLKMYILFDLFASKNRLFLDFE